MTPVACACPTCRAMCETSVCIPTPAEARALIKRYPDRMARYEFAQSVVAPAPAGLEGATLPHTNLGRCTFASAAGCELHDLGLKPLEGRLAHHDRPVREVRVHVLSHWRGRQYQSVCTTLSRELSGTPTKREICQIQQ